MISVNVLMDTLKDVVQFRHHTHVAELFIMILLFVIRMVIVCLKTVVLANLVMVAYVVVISHVLTSAPLRDAEVMDLVLDLINAPVIQDGREFVATNQSHQLVNLYVGQKNVDLTEHVWTKTLAYVVMVIVGAVVKSLHSLAVALILTVHQYVHPMAHV